MEIFILVNFKIIKDMERENIIFIMVENILDSLQTMNFMDKASFIGKMEIFIKVCLKKEILNKVR